MKDTKKALCHFFTEMKSSHAESVFLKTLKN